jgi:hypothetical protein
MVDVAASLKRMVPADDGEESVVVGGGESLSGTSDLKRVEQERQEGANVRSRAGRRQTNVLQLFSQSGDFHSKW